MQKRYLFLMNGRWPMDRYFINNVISEQICVASVYKLYGKDFKYLLAVLLLEKCKLSLEFIWYEEWKKDIEKYDVVIINRSILSWKIIDYIKKKNPKCRIIVWYWDTVNEKIQLPEKYRKYCEVWSFDDVDCQKYNMNFNTQFYLPLDIPSQKIRYDAMFVGRNKGRSRQINEIGGDLQEKGLSFYRYIQKDKFGTGYFYKKDKPELEYEEILQLIAKSRCIIDIPKAGQSGLTIRALEALFYSKKLITTDKNIKNYNFYRKENIFIWGEDDVEKITEFIKSDYQIVDANIRNEYLLENWVKKFEIRHS